MNKMSPDFFKYLLNSSDISDVMFRGLVQQFYYNCRVKNLTEKTLSGYGERLSNFYNFLSSQKTLFENVNGKTIQAYIISQKGKVSDHTINGRIRVLKVFFNYLQKDGLWNNGNPMEEISFIKAEQTLKPILGPDQIEKLLAIPSRRTFQGYRNYCIILTFWDSLVRLSELINMKMPDVDLKAGLIKVYGKGRKERIVPIGVKSMKHLHYYWFRFREKISGEYFFCTSKGKPLAIRHVERILERIGKKAGVYVTPHLIRHSAATWWIKTGAQPMYLQNLMGHTSMSVTQKYIHLASIDDLKNHHNRFSPADSLKV